MKRFSQDCVVALPLEMEMPCYFSSYHCLLLMSPGCALYRGFSLEVFFQVDFSFWRLAAGGNEKMQTSTCSQMSWGYFPVPLVRVPPWDRVLLGLTY